MTRDTFQAKGKMPLCCVKGCDNGAPGDKIYRGMCPSCYTRSYEKDGTPQGELMYFIRHKSLMLGWRLATCKAEYDSVANLDEYDRIAAYSKEWVEQQLAVGADLTGVDEHVQDHQSLQIDVLTIERDRLRERLDRLPGLLIDAIEKEQGRRADEDYLLDYEDCIRVIRETMKKPLTSAPTHDQFEAWALGIAHPVYGWLTKEWMTRENGKYTHPYVQGLWTAVSNQENS